MKHRCLYLFYIVFTLSFLFLYGCNLNLDRLRIVRANYYFNHGNYNAALIDYFGVLSKKSRISKTDMAVLEYDIGTVYFANGEFTSAIEKYENLVDTDYREVTIRTFYNLGSIYYQKGEFEKAAKLFKRVLIENSGDIDAKINLELSLKKLHKAESDKTVVKEREKKKGLEDTALRLLDYLSATEEIFWKPGVSEKKQEQVDW